MDSSDFALLWAFWGGVSGFVVRVTICLSDSGAILILNRGTAERVLELVQKALTPSSKL